MGYLGTMEIDADRDFTHKVGDNFTSNGFEILDSNPPEVLSERKYAKANAPNMPVYLYEKTSDGSSFVLGSAAFIAAIKNEIIEEITFNQMKQLFNQAPGGTPTSKTVSISLNDKVVNLGITFIGLGDVKFAGGTLTMTVRRPRGNLFIVEKEVVITNLTIGDIFDFNFFKTISVFSVEPLGATVQTGFGKPGSVDKVGQVAFVKIIVEGETELVDQTRITP